MCKDFSNILRPHLLKSMSDVTVCYSLNFWSTMDNNRLPSASQARSQGWFSRSTTTIINWNSSTFSTWEPRTSTTKALHKQGQEQINILSNRVWFPSCTRYQEMRFRVNILILSPAQVNPQEVVSKAHDGSRREGTKHCPPPAWTSCPPWSWSPSSCPPPRPGRAGLQRHIRACFHSGKEP